MELNCIGRDRRVGRRLRDAVEFVTVAKDPDLGFLSEVIPVTQYTELNNGIAYIVPQNPGNAPTFNPDAT